MVEPTDHSHGTAETGVTAMPPMPSAEKPEAYRAISILAIIGFAVSCLYAAAIVIGAVVSFAFTRQPWILPVASLAIPLAAAALCWVARNQILSSEGTLAGLPLTKWGMALSLVVALGYAAYYAATAVAVRQQAITFANQYFDLIKNGELDRAFLLTNPPSARPPEGADQRGAMEMELNNSPEVTMPGSYTKFNQQDYVRILQMGGPKSEAELIGVGDWEYKDGGYKVPMQYRLKTSLMTVEMQITVLSREGRGKDPKGRVDAKAGRMWMVVAPETRLQGSEPQPTPEGKEVLQRHATAQPFARDWTMKVMMGKDWDQVYLDLLPPAQRKKILELKENSGPAMAALGPAAMLIGQKDWLDYLKTKAELARTDFVRTDGKQQFWADPKARETMIADVRKVFQEGGRENQPVQVSLMQTMVPLISTEGGKSQFAYDFQMTNLTKYKAEGLIVLETDAANPTPNDWRVSRVEMIRALSPPNTSMPGPGGMGPPGKPGGGPPGGGPPPRQQ